MSTAKRESDNIAFLAGGTFISSQGRIKYRQMFDSVEGIAAIIPREEVQTIAVSPGWERRQPVLFIRWGWDDGTRQFRNESRYVDEIVLDAMGRTHVGADEFLDTEISRWIDTLALANTVGVRHRKYFATGVILWEFGTTYRYPELEIGDVVAAETDTFVARDPHSDRSIVGRAWGIGKVVGHNREGTRFTLWLPSYADIVTNASVVDRSGDGQLITLRVGPDAFTFDLVLTSGTTYTRTSSGSGFGIHPGTAQTDHWLTVDFPTIRARDVRRLRMRYSTDDANSVCQCIAREVLEDDTAGGALSVNDDLGDVGNGAVYTPYDDTWTTDPTDGFLRLQLQLRSGTSTASTVGFFFAEIEVRPLR
jgi:hypothetical protein